MRRHDLEHIIRAAGDFADDDEIIVIGSQAILRKETLLDRLDAMPLDAAHRARIRARIERDFA